MRYSFLGMTNIKYHVYLLATQAQAHKQLRGTTPRWHIMKSTQDVIIIYSQSVHDSYRVIRPEACAINTVTERFKHEAFDLFGTTFEFTGYHIASGT